MILTIQVDFVQTNQRFSLAELCEQLPDTINRAHTEHRILHTPLSNNIWLVKYHYRRRLAPTSISTLTLHPNVLLWQLVGPLWLSLPGSNGVVVMMVVISIVNGKND